MPYQSMLDNYFSSQRPLFSLSKRVWNPPTDIYEAEEETIVKIEVAGLDEKQLQITADRNLLIVRGQRVHSHANQEINYHLMEIHYGYFERVLAFSYSLDQDSIKAAYDKGFIVIRIANRTPRVTNVTVQLIHDTMGK